MPPLISCRLMLLTFFTLWTAFFISWQTCLHIKQEGSGTKCWSFNPKSVIKLSNKVSFIFDTSWFVSAKSDIFQSLYTKITQSLLLQTLPKTSTNIVAALQFLIQFHGRNQFKQWLQQLMVSWCKQFLMTKIIIAVIFKELIGDSVLER